MAGLGIFCSVRASECPLERHKAPLDRSLIVTGSGRYEREDSIRQPWAHLIVTGIKDIENRTWYPSYRGPLLVHASLTAVDEDFEKAQMLLGEPLVRDQIKFGGVVGTCDLVGVVTRHQSPWFTGPYGFLLANPRALNFVPWKGAFGLREVPPELLHLVG